MKILLFKGQWKQLSYKCSLTCTQTLICLQARKQFISHIMYVYMSLMLLSNRLLALLIWHVHGLEYHHMTFVNEVFLHSLW